MSAAVVGVETGSVASYWAGSEARSEGRLGACGGTGAGSCGDWRHEGRDEPQMSFEAEDG